MKELEKTQSVCPECFKEEKIKKIDARIVEEEGKIWITKECPKHGFFKDIVSNDAALYHRWNKYKVTGEGVKNIEIKSFFSPEEKLYPRHQSQTVLTNVMLTNRCNLRCGYCFMNAGAAGYIYEPSLEQLRKIMKQVRDEKPVPSQAVQFTGGEPTIREDLFEIIKMAKEMGFVQIQLNTNGIKLADSIEYCQKIKDSGVQTIYLSFDGVTKQNNPWIEQNKKAIENLRKVGIISIVLVPVVMRRNIHELPEIVKFAVQNMDVIRGVNFQPIAFTGRVQNVSTDYVKKERVDYVDAIEALEKGLDGQIKKEDFYPVPFVYPISKLIENMKGKKQVEFTAHPSCGGATYVFIEDGKMIPITRFVDVAGLMEFINKQSKKTGLVRNTRIALAFLMEVSKYVDKKKAPKGFDMIKLLIKTAKTGTFEGLKEFQYRTIYVGSMWFQDVWDMDLERLKRCVIHYATLDGVIPFCAYNSLGVGEKIRKKYSISFEEWKKRTGRTMEDDLWKGIGGN